MATSYHLCNLLISRLLHRPSPYWKMSMHFFPLWLHFLHLKMNTVVCLEFIFSTRILQSFNSIFGYAGLTNILYVMTWGQLIRRYQRVPRVQGDPRIQWFQVHGWDASPSQGCPPALNSPVLIYTPGWREAVSKKSFLPKNTTQCPRLGIEPRLLDPVSSVLDMTPPCFHNNS